MSLSSASFTIIADLVMRDSAMVYSTGKEYLVEARLLPVAKAAGYPDVDSLIASIDRNKRLAPEVLDALMINETSWFRDQNPYQTFVDYALPQLMQAQAGTQHIHLWSAACSSGQEAYSLAILLDQNLPPGWEYTIHCTDISTQMVTRTQKGVYSQVEMNRGMPAAYLLNYFTKVGTEWQVIERLRKRITTQQLNLDSPFYNLGPFDAVFMRNVLIYFDGQTKEDIISKTHSTLANHGVYIIGSTESMPPANTLLWDLKQEDRSRLYFKKRLTPSYAPLLGGNQTTLTAKTA